MQGYIYIERVLTTCKIDNTIFLAFWEVILIMKRKEEFDRKLYLSQKFIIPEKGKWCG